MVGTHSAAALKGDSEAQWKLASAYYHGSGAAPKDFALALHFGLMAANAGHAAAQNLVGWMYACAEGVPADSAVAVHWMQKAAAQGFAQANQNMGE